MVPPHLSPGRCQPGRRQPGRRLSLGEQGPGLALGMCRLGGGRRAAERGPAGPPTAGSLAKAPSQDTVSVQIAREGAVHLPKALGP